MCIVCKCVNTVSVESADYMAVHADSRPSSLSPPHFPPPLLTFSPSFLLSFSSSFPPPSQVALVYGQMNEPPGARARVALTGLTVAEYFRDQEGQDVLLFIDNIFRFTQAGSEVCVCVCVWV